MSQETLHCPHCNQRLKIGAGLLGQTLNCPGCRRPFQTASPTNPPPVRRPVTQAAAEPEALFQDIAAGGGEEPSEPWYYRAVFFYVLPLKIAAVTAALMWALLPCLVSSLPFVLASDISDAMGPTTHPAPTTPAPFFPRPEADSTPARPAPKTPFFMMFIYVVGFILSLALDAVFLLGTFLLVDYACTSVDAARNIRRLRYAQS